MTDGLQPMDISVNKPAKDFLKRQFDEWYSQQVLAQLEDDTSNLEELEIQPFNLGLPELKEIGAKWLVDMATYSSDNPQMIINGFIRSGIAGALDGQETGKDEQVEYQEFDSEDDFDESEVDFYDIFAL